jgi:hypothetical protein
MAEASPDGAFFGVEASERVPAETAGRDRPAMSWSRPCQAGCSASVFAKDWSHRPLVVREHAMKGKDRWHALFILHDDTMPALALLHEYRTRQHHEQDHRIGVHDLRLDTSPSGYPKRGRPDRPGFRQGSLTRCAWITTLAWDALRALGYALPARFHLAHPRTLRRWESSSCPGSAGAAS